MIDFREVGSRAGESALVPTAAPGESLPAAVSFGEYCPERSDGGPVRNQPANSCQCAAPRAGEQASSHARSLGSNTRERVRNLTPSGASSEKPEPQPGTTSIRS